MLIRNELLSKPINVTAFKTFSLVALFDIHLYIKSSNVYQDMHAMIREIVGKYYCINEINVRKRVHIYGEVLLYTRTLRQGTWVLASALSAFRFLGTWMEISQHP